MSVVESEWEWCSPVLEANGFEGSGLRLAFSCWGDGNWPSHYLRRFCYNTPVGYGRRIPEPSTGEHFKSWSTFQIHVSRMCFLTGPMFGECTCEQQECLLKGNVNFIQQLIVFRYPWNQKQVFVEWKWWWYLISSFVCVFSVFLFLPIWSGPGTPMHSFLLLASILSSVDAASHCAKSAGCRNLLGGWVPSWIQWFLLMDGRWGGNVEGPKGHWGYCRSHGGFWISGNSLGRWQMFLIGSGNCVVTF